MPNRQRQSWILLGILPFALSACGEAMSRCGATALTLWPRSSGQYQLQEVRARSLNSLAVLEGPAARVSYEGRMTNEGFAGPAAQPELTNADGLCVPQNAASSAAVSVFLQFERLQAFDRDLGVANLLSWPRQVGVDTRVSTASGQGKNNAHYDATGDMIVILPYEMSDAPASQRVPTAMNHGIVAHEHFHAYFQKWVLNPFNEQWRGKRAGPLEDMLSADVESFVGINSLVLRAWNEGLADFYAGIYTGDPRFIEKSLPRVAVGRVLTAEVQELWTAASLKAKLDEVRTAKRMERYVYEQGALFARLLYQLAKLEGEARARRERLGAIIRRLPDIQKRLGSEMNERIFGMEEALPILLDGVELSEEACALLDQAMTKPGLHGGFATCVRR